MNARVESASAYEVGEMGLCRPDGSGFHPEEVHGEEFNELARERNGLLLR